MKEILDTIFHSFWTFIGSFFMISMIITLPLGIVRSICIRIMRFYTMKRLGYPPPHCDADGDFKQNETK